MDVYLCNIIFSLQTLEKYYPKEEVESSLYARQLPSKRRKLLWTFLRLGLYCSMGGLLSPWHILLVWVFCVFYTWMCKYFEMLCLWSVFGNYLRLWDTFIKWGHRMLISSWAIVLSFTAHAVWSGQLCWLHSSLLPAGPSLAKNRTTLRGAVTSSQNCWHPRNIYHHNCKRYRPW